LAGVSISVGQIAAPLLSVTKVPGGGQQINFQVPFEATSNLLEVRYRGFSTYAWPVTAIPSILELPDGSPMIQHAADFSFVTATNPAARGEDIVIWATGLGPAALPVPSGMPAQSAVPLPKQAFPQASVGTTTYAGIVPGSIGLYQVNVRLRTTLASGNQDLQLGGSLGELAVVSNKVTLPIQ
jgi:uncharacterized protein (TIGR03437 family)